MYIKFEKILFVSFSVVLVVITAALYQQYYFFKQETEKMILVRQEYYNVMMILKQSIQSNNINDIDDDLDDFKDQDEAIVEDVDSDVVIESESQEEAINGLENLEDDSFEQFQFVSAEDEKQLKHLRKQAVTLVKKKKSYKKPLVQKQLNQFKKVIDRQPAQDFTFHWPLELHHFWISSLFGARKKADGSPGFHYGVDLAAMKGTPVKSAADGIVIQAQYLPGYGNNILIQHNKYYKTRYAHLHTMNVSEGQRVVVGQKIGTVGATGSVRKTGRDASHLHFEIYHHERHVNPLRYLFS